MPIVRFDTRQQLVVVPDVDEDLRIGLHCFVQNAKGPRLEVGCMFAALWLISVVCHDCFVVLCSRVSVLLSKNFVVFCRGKNNMIKPLIGRGSSLRGVGNPQT